MFKLGVGDNLDEIIAALTDVERRQLPFAMAGAANDMAFAGRKVAVNRLQSSFTIRKKWSGGFRVEKATKAKPHAVLGSTHGSLKLHETGGSLKSRSFSGRYIPTLAAREGGSFSGKVQRGLKPKALLKKIAKAEARSRGGKRRGKKGGSPGAFIIKDKRGKISGIFSRSSKSRLPIEKLFSVKNSVKIERTLKFGVTLENLTDRKFTTLFVSRLDQAFKTAKGGAIKSSFIAEKKASLMARSSFDDTSFSSSTLTQITR